MGKGTYIVMILVKRLTFRNIISTYVLLISIGLYYYYKNLDQSEESWS